MSILFHCKSQHSIQRIDFTKSARGFLEEVVLTRDSVHIKIENARSADPVQQFSEKLSPKKWSQLNDIVKDISLSEMPSYESPTKKRTYDGALHGSITLTTDDGKAYVHGFDDENPHPKLQPLMKCILEIRDKGKRVSGF